MHAIVWTGALGWVVATAGCLWKPSLPDTFADAEPSLAVGGRHACWLDRGSQSVVCWGSNGHRQLGVTGVAFTGTPTLATTTIGWTALAAGSTHTCGIRNGTVACWGDDARGQCGTPDGGDVSFTDVPLPDGAIPAQVFAGGDGSCAIDTSGRLWCWGVYDATTPFVTSPTGVTPGGVASGWRSVALADDHACALHDSGSVYCWGRNEVAQLGVADGQDAAVAVARSKSGQTFAAIAVATGVTCAVTGNTASGRLVCWGARSGGQLGPGDPSSSTDEAIVDPALRWADVVIGPEFACGVTTDHEVYCLGNDPDGALGDSFTGRTALPDAPAIAGMLELHAGDHEVCGRNADGVWCWGSNAFGELGNTEVATERAPVMVFDAGPQEIKAIALGDGHSCAMFGDNNDPFNVVRCWGDNRARQVDGVGASPFVVVPTATDPTTNIDQLTAGARHTCARGTTPPNPVVCWGDNSQMQLGGGQFTLTVSPSATWYHVAAGGSTTCAIGSDERLHCWGKIPGTATTTSALYDITGVSNWLAVAVGADFAGGPQATADQFNEWGTECNIGNTPPNSSMPRANAAMFSAWSMSLAGTGGGHACVMIAEPAPSYTVWCWGRNEALQAGGPGPTACQPRTAINFASPWGPVLNGQTKVAVAGSHSCAIDAGSHLQCWGLNVAGELGDRIPFGALSAGLQVNDDLWLQVAAGRYHTCAIHDDGGGVGHSVWCWGKNAYGEVGSNKRFHETPVKVALP